MKLYVRNKEIIISENSTDKYLSFAACFQVTIVGVKNALVQSIPYFYSINSLLNSLLLGIVGLVYIYAMSKSWQRYMHMRASVFAVITIVICSFVFSALYFPGNGTVIADWMPRILPYCFITFLLLAELDSLDWIEYYMTKFCYVTIVFSAMGAVFIYKNGHITMSNWSSYSMPLSYVTLVAVMWLMYKFFQKESIIDLLFILTGLIVITAYGSRNPLLAIVCFFAIQTLRNAYTRKIQGMRRLLYFVGSVLMLFIAVFWRQTITLLSQMYTIFSINSRTLKLLSQNTISNSGRENIHASLWELLNDNPFLGLGVGGDVRVINESAHGLFLSIFISYGYILGAMFIIAILLICIWAYFKSFGRNKDIVLLYICMVLPRGFTGGDIWTSDVFWWMLGICISVISLSHNSSNQYWSGNDKRLTYN